MPNYPLKFMKKPSLLNYCLLFVLTLGLAVGCSNPANNLTTSSSTPSAAPNAVTIGFSAWPGWFPWQVTADENIFTQNNVNAQMKWFDGYAESISTLAAKQIDANSQTLGDTLSSVAAGAHQVIVLVNDNSTGNDQIIVRAGINSIQDLKGKKVAAEEGTVDHFLLLQGLEKAGMKVSDIQFVPLETGKAAAAFVAGQLDAVAVFAPFTTEALKRPGSKTLFSSKDFPGSISDHLVFTQDFVDQHPDQVQAIVDSWFATLAYIKANPAKSDQIMAERAGVSLKDYHAYATGTHIFTLAENLKAFEPGNTMISLQFAAQKMAKFLEQQNLTPHTPDLTHLFDDRFVKAYAAKLKKA